MNNLQKNRIKHYFKKYGDCTFDSNDNITVHINKDAKEIKKIFKNHLSLVFKTPYQVGLLNKTLTYKFSDMEIDDSFFRIEDYGFVDYAKLEFENCLFTSAFPQISNFDELNFIDCDIKCPMICIWTIGNNKVNFIRTNLIKNKSFDVAARDVIIRDCNIYTDDTHIGFGNGCHEIVNSNIDSKQLILRGYDLLVEKSMITADNCNVKTDLFELHDSAFSITNELNLNSKKLNLMPGSIVANTAYISVDEAQLPSYQLASTTHENIIGASKEMIIDDKSGSLKPIIHSPFVIYNNYSVKSDDIVCDADLSLIDKRQEVVAALKKVKDNIDDYFSGVSIAKVFMKK